MDYQEALDWVMSFWDPGRPKEQERTLRRLKVPRMRALLERLGSPHERYASVLVAGTKGKGSTAAFMAEGLRAAGYRAGRYTQPHLVDWRERTWVGGEIISPEEVARLAERIRPVVEELNREGGGLGTLTTYEVGTAITLCHFADRGAEIAVLEIGIGGRFDALNAVEPVLSVVTAISHDHTDVLGTTLREIATEKAGILRPGGVAVSAPQQPEAEEALRAAAADVGARLHFVGRADRSVGRGLVPRRLAGAPASCRPRPDDTRDRRDADAPREERAAGHEAPPYGPDEPADWTWREGVEPRTIAVAGPYGELAGLRVVLLGDHQRDNATVAVAALQLLGERGFRVAEPALRRGLSEVDWPGRIQTLRERPLVVADAAHNVDSCERLLATVRKEFQFDRLILVFGASAGKDSEGMAAVLGPAARRVVVASSGHRRAVGLGVLAKRFERYAPVAVMPDPAAAFAAALAGASEGDLVLITGSVFLAGRALELLG